MKCCKNLENKIIWFKLEGKFNTKTRIINSSRIRTKIIMSGPLEETSYLMFNDVQEIDSGVYWCESREAVSFIVTVSVTGELDFFSQYLIHPFKINIYCNGEKLPPKSLFIHYLESFFLSSIYFFCLTVFMLDKIHKASTIPTGLNFLYPALKMAAISVLVIIVSAVSIWICKSRLFSRLILRNY